MLTCIDHLSTRDQLEDVSFFFRNPNVYPGGELIFGDIDPTKYSGSITYVDVIIHAYWEFFMNKLNKYTLRIIVLFIEILTLV